MNGRDLPVAKEVRSIQGQQVSEAMGVHGGDKTGVVNLPPTHTIIVDQATPYGMNLFVVGQKREVVLDEPDFLLCFAVRQAEAVSIQWPRQNVPQLHDVLWAIIQAGILLK